MGVVFVLQTEYHLSITTISILSHSLDGQSNFSFLVAAGRRNLTPVWLAGYFPFAFGVNHQFLLMLRAQGAGYRWTANELVVSCDSLEVAPAWCCLILGNGRLWYFESEVIFGYAVESTTQNTCRNLSPANDAVNAKIVGKSTTILSPCWFITNTRQTFWENKLFYTTAISKSSSTNRF